MENMDRNDARVRLVVDYGRYREIARSSAMDLVDHVGSLIGHVHEIDRRTVKNVSPSRVRETSLLVSNEKLGFELSFQLKDTPADFRLGHIVFVWLLRRSSGAAPQI